MGFEWDPAKDNANFAKHGITFDEATEVFADPSRLVVSSTKPEHREARWLAIGRYGPHVMSVIFTVRHDEVRIISARRASKDEREQYRQSATSS